VASEKAKDHPQRWAVKQNVEAIQREPKGECMLAWAKGKAVERRRERAIRGAAGSVQGKEGRRFELDGCTSGIESGSYLRTCPG
jgi:hypothetical protein